MRWGYAHHQEDSSGRGITCRTVQQSFATHLLECGYDIRTVRELLGHKDVKTTMIYIHVLNRGPAGVRSPVAGRPVWDSL